MKDTLSSRLRKHIELSGLLRAGDRAGVAVSGGADSVALLLLLVEIQKALGISLSVVHFNHKIRGAASEKDEKAVAKLASSLCLSFHVGRSDVKAEAKAAKLNLEEAARRARYGFFAKVAREERLDKIAVAHTADDQAETVLAHILRGSGLGGLGGIHPTMGRIVRPLLEFRRAELRAYLRSAKRRWREDATNRDTTRMRARIRKRLVPLLEKQFQPAVVEHLGSLAKLAREDEQFLNALASERLERLADSKPGSIRILVGDLLGSIGAESVAENGGFRSKNLAISRRMIRLMVKQIKPGAGQLAAEHVRAVVELAAYGENGKRLPLPGGVQVVRESDSLVFCGAPVGNDTADHGGVEFKHVIQIDRSEIRVAIPELRCALRFRVIDWPSQRSDTIDTGAALDRDALDVPLVLRNWRAGDRFRPLGHRNAHKVKRLLSEQRVGGAERHSWPVLASGSRIVWVRGLAVAAEFAATERTRNAVVIEEETAS